MERNKISLAAARVNAKLQQKDVAKVLGIAQETLLNWEKGKTSPRIEQARKLAAMYGIPLQDIFFANSI